MSKPLRKLGGMSLLSLLLCALVSVGARAQNLVYTFYDGPNATGNVLGTYVGPLITDPPGCEGVSCAYPTFTSGVTLNPGALVMSPSFPPPSTAITATTLTPCLLFTAVDGVPGWFQCSLNIFSTENINFVMYGALPPGPGVYEQSNATYFLHTDPDPVTGVTYTSQPALSLRIGPAIPTYSCTGFQTPFNVPLSIKSKVNRAIPLKDQLFDSTGKTVVASDLPTPPIVNVLFTSITGTGTDETALLDPVGQSSSGNQFNYDSTSQTWWFNLATTPFTASGTYMVTLQSGDVTKYLVSPQCSGTFVRP